jgi:hypothetical protein
VLARQVGDRLGVSVHLGTARFEAGAYTDSMQPKSIQVFIAVMWV